MQYPVKIEELNKKTVRLNPRSFKIIAAYLILFFIHHFAESNINVNPVTMENIFLKKKTYTFLVVGTDKKIGVNRTDTIFVVFWDMNRKSIDVINIPRDTRAIVSGSGSRPEGYRKINAAYAYGSKKSHKNGIRELIKSIHSIMDFHLDYYILVDLASFVKIIDVLGGIPIDVDMDMEYEDKAGGLKIDLKKGMQVLDGDKAMQYVRYRGKKFGDIGRISRQQKFINAIIGKMKDYRTWMKINSLLDAVMSNVYTNMSVSSMLGFARELLDLRNYRNQFHLLPGNPAYIEKVSYYIVNHDDLESLVEKIISGKKEK